jgi:hypothetical protein
MVFNKNDPSFPSFRFEIMVEKAKELTKSGKVQAIAYLFNMLSSS